MKKKVLLVFGGKSCEHDISIITALQAAKCLDDDKYEVLPLYIKDDKMYTGNALFDLGGYKNFCAKGLKKCSFINGGIKASQFFRRKIKIDCALICCHGGIGENGGLQGLFDFFDIAYTSAGVAPCAVFMDKELTKLYLKARDLPALPYQIGRGSNTNCRVLSVNCQVAANSFQPPITDFPVIVKPATLGSSIGISVAHNEKELENALEIANEFDRKILVETALTDFFEINCAAVRYKGKILVSECEKPVSWKEFLTFEDKYLGSKKGDSSKGMKNLKREFPAKISAQMQAQIKDITYKIYSDLNLKGSVRVDFLVDKKTDTVYVNEVNTIPGSLAFYLFESSGQGGKNSGLTFKKLLGGMIEEGIAERQAEKTKRFEFKSGVLN